MPQIEIRRIQVRFVAHVYLFIEKNTFLTNLTSQNYISGTVSNQLILKEVEKLPEHTTVLQVEDGEKTLHLLISA